MRNRFSHQLSRNSRTKALIGTFNLSYFDISLRVANGYIRKVVTIITVRVVVVTLLFVGSLIFYVHDYDDERNYGYVEEFYKKLEYFIQRIDVLEEHLKT